MKQFLGKGWQKVDFQDYELIKADIKERDMLSAKIAISWLD